MWTAHRLISLLSFQLGGIISPRSPPTTRGTVLRRGAALDRLKGQMGTAIIPLTGQTTIPLTGQTTTPLTNQRTTHPIGQTSSKFHSSSVPKPPAHRKIATRGVRAVPPSKSPQHLFIQVSHLGSIIGELMVIEQPHPKVFSYPYIYLCDILLDVSLLKSWRRRGERWWTLPNRETKSVKSTLEVTNGRMRRSGRKRKAASMTATLALSSKYLADWHARIACLLWLLSGPLKVLCPSLQ